MGRLKRSFFKNHIGVLYKGFDTVAFYGKEHEKMNSQQKEDMIRDRFSAILALGLPELNAQTSLHQESEKEDEIYS
ncbi:hypothetical protein [Anabaena sp. CCY 9402-a]|uniref:hypothetical protein n=1 Tax=Anabaena sp. CCY 9402-a TaxID=3103867 RepID=UPI0039C74FE4